MRSAARHGRALSGKQCRVAVGRGDRDTRLRSQAQRRSALERADLAGGVVDAQVVTGEGTYEAVDAADGAFGTRIALRRATTNDVTVAECARLQKQMKK